MFLLLGPTGTGKTKTVEALAEVLHGSEKNVLKVDCGEFQMEHEVAKLIGAPPGYLGHRETQPMLTQQKLNAVTSEKCSLSLVLFDEIEKAAPSMTRLLLGVLDKGILRLGDNSTVNFEKSLVFLTSNLGAREMMREINPDFGFQSVKARRARGPYQQTAEHRAGVGPQAFLAGVRQPHRLHHHVPAAHAGVAVGDSRPPDLRPAEPRQYAAGQPLVHARRAVRSAAVPAEERHQLRVRRARIEPHDSPLPDAAAGHHGGDQPGERRRAGAGGGGRGRRQAEHPQRGHSTAVATAANPTVLLVDDNRDLLHFLERLMADAGWTLLTAESATEAKRLVQEHKPNAALLDYMLPDGNGVELGVEFLQAVPQMLVIVMTGTILPPEEEALCEEHNFPVLAEAVPGIRRDEPDPQPPDTRRRLAHRVVRVVVVHHEPAEAAELAARLRLEGIDASRHAYNPGRKRFASSAPIRRTRS